MSNGKIFISYSRQDTAVMQRVKNRLQQAGVSVWTDEGLRPGTKDWQMAIEREIEACDAMIVLLSPAACESEWVRREINRADRLVRLVLPMIISDVPTSLIPLLLENTQHINASSDLDAGLSTLLTELTSRGWAGVKPVEQASDVQVSEEDKSYKPRASISERLRKLPDSLWAIGIIFVIFLMLIFVIWIGEKVLGPFVDAETPITETLTSSDDEVSTKTPQLADEEMFVVESSEPSSTETEIFEPTITPSPTPEELPQFITDTFGVPMALIPAGPFQMGSEDGNDDEKPVHTVTLDDFYIDQYEVTNARYAECVDAGICNSPTVTSSNTRTSYFGNSAYTDYPVIYISWDAAEAYCQWRQARLPTEVEWEKAARGEDGRAYPWGDTPPDCTLANWGGVDGCVGDTNRVGSYLAGASPYKVLDMAGNVSEWTQSIYRDYPYDATDGRENQEYGDFVVRGGSWSYFGSNLRAAYRLSYYFSRPFSGVGFRCAQDVAP